MTNTMYQDLDVKDVINAKGIGAELKAALIDLFLPVGKRVEQHLGEQTPAELYPNTTWAIDTEMQGRVPVGSGGSYELGAQGGSENAVVVKHTHTFVGAYAQANPGFLIQTGSGNTAFNFVELNNFIDEAGESGTGKNMQPYTVITYWKRVA